MQALDQTPPVSLSDVLASHASFAGHKVALVCNDELVTWAELDRRVSKVANGLLASGLVKGDKVALIAANCTAMIEILLGINRAGAVAVPLSLLAPAEALDRMLDDSQSKAPFVSTTFERLIEPYLDGLPLVEPSRRFGIGSAAAGWIGYDAWRDRQSSERHRPHPIRAAADEPRLGARIPLHSDFGRPRHHAALQQRHLDDVPARARLERERVTPVFMVPPQFVAVLGHPRVEGADLSSLQVMLSAGSAVRGDTKRRVPERMGPDLMELYGLTEGVGTILRPEDVTRKTDSVGTPALGSDFRIIDNDGRELPGGQIGAIIGYSTGPMKWYHNRPDATREAVWIAEDGRTYLKTGDIGKLDEEGFLYLLDRKKDMILSGGFNVYPRDTEEVAARHPDIADVAVIGMPDPRWDEVPVALVVPRPGTAPDPGALKEWINQRVAKYQRVAWVAWVAWVAFRETFPRNALGVLKKELRAEYAAR